jgi:hypothetical protein
VIRVAYPVPPVRQFRLRLELATRRTRRAIEQRSAPHTLREGDALHSRWREDIRLWRASYNEFEDRYDRLVGLLCLAAHEGITPSREDAYREQRLWFLQNYASVKRELGRYLCSDPSDTTPGLWGRRPCDAYEALFLPGSLEGMLAADNGNLIGRLTRTQEALTAWNESLRRAEKALAAAENVR